MLQDEVEKAQRAVRTDAYQMSVGEIVSLYRDGELVINPDFQRLFRWEIGQKSKLIESLLLGIPLPSIFVFETEDAKWELIDGLQRISTILEFMGLLREPGSSEARAPSALTATKYLPSLSNTVWERSDQIKEVPESDQVPLDKHHQLAIRRARIGVEILKRPSDNATKYDLFQRLNAGGTPANAQELRNCIIIMVDGAYFGFLRFLANNSDFKAVISATEDQIERQRHMEWATRFLVHNYCDYDGRLDVEEYIDEGIVLLASEGGSAAQRTRFETTFAVLNRVYQGDSLRRFEDGKFSGRVGLAAFECIAVGLGHNIESISRLAHPDEFVRQKVAEFWEVAEFAPIFRSWTSGHNSHPTHSAFWEAMVLPVSRPFTEDNLSDDLDSDLTWRIREFSDLKDAIRLSAVTSRAVLLRALVAMLYAHWEGYVKFCAEKYFDHVTMRRHRFNQLESQLYVNYFLARVDALASQRVSLRDRCGLINDIISSKENRFSRINKDLIDTGSNLTSKVLRDICVICAVDFGAFDSDSGFIDRILVKRRNQIAHGDETYIAADEVDDLISKVVGLMRLFRNSLENKVYQRSYLAAPVEAGA